MESLAARCRPAAILLASVLAAPALAQSTWYVDGSSPGPGSGTLPDPYASIQYALHQPTTLPGDVLLVAPGVYHENVSIDRFGVTLRSTGGAEATTIHARGPGSTLLVRHADAQNRTRIEGFTITGGSGSEHALGPVGGGVLLDETPATLSDCVVRANRALRGAGIAVLHAELTLEGAVLEINVAESAPRSKDGHGGGLFAKGSPQVTLRGCLVSANLAGRGGGIYATNSRVVLQDVHVENNHISQGDFLDECGQGAGLYAFAGSARLEDVDFVANLARGSGTMGGGARLVKTRTTISGGSFVGNAAGAFWPDTLRWPSDGGALASDCDLEVVGTEFVGNVASERGGAILGRGQFLSCSIRENKARFGGGAWTSIEHVPLGCFFASLRFERCDFERNVATGASFAAEGGGVCGPALLERCRLVGNAARGNGGGAARATLIDCVLQGNSAAAAQLCLCTFGGGAYECYVEGCQVLDNRSVGVGKGVGYGGGVYGGTLRRTVLAGNAADFGGAVAMATTKLMDHLTIWDNHATYGGGGVYFMSPGFLRNSIVFHNRPDCIGGASDRAVVTWSDIEGGCPGLGNEDVDPCFWAPEQDDFHLIAGSPCIDSGDPLAPPDPDGSRADKGALPFAPDWCGGPVNLCQAKPNSAGCVPSIAWRGTPSLDGTDDFVVGAVDVLGGQPGLLMLSTTPDEIPVAGGGTLCLGLPILRVATAVSGGNPSGMDCSGTFAFELPRSVFESHGLGAGQTLYAQIVYRDSGLVPPNDVGLTDALRFTLCP